ncbi:MAG: NADH-dependent flavin oxidoreductase [Bacilli bacterium]|nr:NADH-dependent flavin oxidoreductase [Bacilli bacterium]
MKEVLQYEIRKGVVLKNRFVLAPMTTYSGNSDLTLSEEERIYYQARGKQFGMVVTAATAISRHAQAFPNQISIMDDGYLESMKLLAKAIQSGGAKAILQLHHGGRMNVPGLYEGQDIVSASSIKANRDYAVQPRELTNEEVYQVIEDFKHACIRAIQAGFDGVELHGANTYLIQQFFSPNSNVRTDEFGGSLEKRMTFPLKLVREIVDLRETLKKPNFIIGYRLSPEELENPGITIEDTKVLVNELSKTAIDYIHLSLGSYKQTSIRDKSVTTPIIQVLQQENVGRKKMIGVGGIESMDEVYEALDMGFDLIAIGMASLADTEVVTHLLNNQQLKKTFDKDSLLPTPMMNRVKAWKNIQDRGYEIKI